MTDAEREAIAAGRRLYAAREAVTASFRSEDRPVGCRCGEPCPTACAVHDAMHDELDAAWDAFDVAYERLP